MMRLSIIVVIVVLLQVLFTLLWLADMVPQLRPEVTNNIDRPPIIPRPLQIISSVVEGEPIPSPTPTLPLAVTEPTDCPLKDLEIIYPIPKGVEESQMWRYLSKGLYWSKCDKLYQKAVKYNRTLTLPPDSVKKEIDRICDKLTAKNRNKLCLMFKTCFPNTLETTVQILHDGTSYVITGDIPLMWLRDSAAQVHQYLPLAKEDPHLQIIIEGIIRRDIKWILLDPYGSSFRLFLDFDHAGKTTLNDWDYKCGRTIHVAMHDWEIDSLAYFVKLSYDYWKITGIGDIFDEEWKKAAELIIRTFETERNHISASEYSYPTLRNNGKGSHTCPCGLIWSGMRPSDDSCMYHFLIPSNMFAVVALREISEIFAEFYPQDTKTKLESAEMAEEIDDAIHEVAVVTRDQKEIYAYEVNGCGSFNAMDDANVPSLLSIPYLNYTTPHDPKQTIYANTRQFVLSSRNEWYFSGSRGKGIGSPHTSRKMVWPMSIIMRAMTSTNSDEINEMIDMLEETDAGKNQIHESFDVDNPERFTRHWFAWANSLFSEMIIQKIDVIKKKT